MPNQTPEYQRAWRQAKKDRLDRLEQQFPELVAEVRTTHRAFCYAEERRRPAFDGRTKLTERAVVRARAVYRTALNELAAAEAAAEPVRTTASAPTRRGGRDAD